MRPLVIFLSLLALAGCDRMEYEADKASKSIHNSVARMPLTDRISFCSDRAREHKENFDSCVQRDGYKVNPEYAKVKVRKYELIEVFEQIRETDKRIANPSDGIPYWIPE